MFILWLKVAEVQLRDRVGLQSTGSSSFKWTGRIFINMGSKPVKQKKEEYLVKVVPPLDPDFVRWLARDLERIHGFVPNNPRAIKPPEHYIQQMRLNGWLDLDLDDPDLAHLFQ
ncbi:hypothetical protein IFM89_021511 [Coptis chinensis]|uniref:Uncharacterized protein n=1 Tax=Coptis chinensis TaxID=261450 RepID=A0A835LMA6_9MAGN|nr:hypothetical protein IFM89_021511 [Coptis chinensis]